MFSPKKPDVDVILDILNESHAANPASPFISSLLNQDQERGSLSKKQLEGLYSKASKLNIISTGKLATLEAIIGKMPTRYKSLPRFPTPLYQKNEEAGRMINSILFKSPSHKRVLFLKNKFEHNEILTPADLAELQKFFQIVVERKP